jgi:hypothetical protein
VTLLVLLADVSGNAQDACITQLPYHVARWAAAVLYNELVGAIMLLSMSVCHACGT